MPLSMNIATATVSVVPSAQGVPNERHLLEFFGIFNLISRDWLLGGY